MTITFQSAVLFVQDIARSRQFYESVLGQTVTMDFGANIGFKGFAIWQIDSVNEIIFGSAHHVTGVQGKDNVELYFETTDLAGVEQALTAAAIPFLQPRYEQPWGQRALRVYDPDRHIVEIAETMGQTIQRMVDEGQTASEIAARTFMPLAAVQYIIEHGEFPPTH